MKTISLITVILCSCWFRSGGQDLPGETAQSQGWDNPGSTSVTSNTTISGEPFLNAGFEAWTGALPDYWSEVLDRSGDVLNSVRVSMEDSIKAEGRFSVKVESIQPCGGIGHPVSGDVPEAWYVYPVEERAALHYAKENGTSAWFSPHTLVQEDFELFTVDTSTAIRNPEVLRLDNGDLIEIFSACIHPETGSGGAVYMKRNGGEPVMFLNFEGHRTWTRPGIIDMGNKYVLVTSRNGCDGQQHLYATDVSRDFEYTENDRLLFDMPDCNVQSYRMIRLPDGRIVIPIVYAAIENITTGPWYLDILTTTDFYSVTRLNIPRTYKGRGLMEAYPVMQSDGTVAILCRTNQKHLAKLIFNPVEGTLTEAVPTEIVQPEAGSFAMNLSDSSILLSWIANIDLRKVLVMAVSDDNMETWHSYHILMTSAAMGQSMTIQIPYIHQPYVFEDTDGSLVCYFEEVTTTTDINLYKTSSSTWRVNNIANQKNTWQSVSVEKPPAATSLQLLNIIGSCGKACFDQPMVAGYNQIKHLNVKVYPNPVDDILHISSQNRVLSVEIIGMNGTLICKQGESKTLPVKDLPTGIYFVRIRFAEEVVVVKILKI